ncbi:20S proteasome subunit [Ceratobasidium sp. AG-Ba]|nr:20S proteasome subunit [Ceratobasidium sp. AG-Ba]QRW01978.1 20S proteasome subunit [Ceratobasidium sp. AG-Ba]
MSHNEIFTDSDSDGAILPTPDAEPINTSESSSPPTSGPEFFEWRRKQWLAARPKDGQSTRARQTSDSTSYAKLEAVVTTPGYEYDDKVWTSYLQSVNERLKGGVTLRKPLPLWVVIRVLRVGWMRDGTWYGPGGAPTEPVTAATLGTSSAMTETPAMTPTAFLSELSTPASTTPVPAVGKVFATRRIRAPGWNSAALEVERVLRAVESGPK